MRCINFFSFTSYFVHNHIKESIANISHYLEQVRRCYFFIRGVYSYDWVEFIKIQTHLKMLFWQTKLDISDCFLEWIKNIQILPIKIFHIYFLYLSPWTICFQRMRFFIWKEHIVKLHRKFYASILWRCQENQMK